MCVQLQEFFSSHFVVDFINTSLLKMILLLPQVGTNLKYEQCIAACSVVHQTVVCMSLYALPYIVTTLSRFLAALQLSFISFVYCCFACLNIF